MAESANAATPCTSAGVGSPVPEYVRFELVDFNAKALSKLVPMRHKESKVFMYSGALAMGANATVLTFPDEVNENGCCNSELLPDWSTLIELPWAGTETPPRKIYRVCCEQRTPAGELVNPATPRAACRRLVEELKQQHGLELFAASELEFSVMEKDEAGELQPIFQGVDIFATLQQSKCAELQRYPVGGQCGDIPHGGQGDLPAEGPTRHIFLLPNGRKGCWQRGAFQLLPLGRRDIGDARRCQPFRNVGDS
jgi:glutamine synthetase